MNIDHRWDEMLDEFRALGGTAENVCLRTGRLGRGLFARDPSKPVKLHIPKNLLVAPKDMELTEEGCRLRPALALTGRERSFLEAYQSDFGWGSSARNDIEQMLALMDTAPPDLRQFMQDSLRVTRWFGGPTAEKVRERFFGTRVIEIAGQDFIMPILELANHGPGEACDTSDGVTIGGQFSGEILVRYYESDALEIFKNWGFVSQEDFALSLTTGLKTEASELIVGRSAAKPEAEQKVPFFPTVTRKDGQLTLSYMLLGHKKFPRLAKGVFHRIMRDAGRSDFDEAFDFIQHLNRQEFLKLLELSEAAPPELAALLRRLAHHQLTAMSFSVGIRQL